MAGFTTKSGTPAQRLFVALERSVWSVLRKVTRWQSLTKTRCHLARLERDELADIGLTQRQRLIECAKWFWQK